jgi:hypothetical protein
LTGHGLSDSAAKKKRIFHDLELYATLKQNNKLMKSLSAISIGPEFAAWMPRPSCPALPEQSP